MSTVLLQLTMIRQAYGEQGRYSMIYPWYCKKRNIGCFLGQVVVVRLLHYGVSLLRAVSAGRNLLHGVCVSSRRYFCAAGTKA